MYGDALATDFDGSGIALVEQRTAAYTTWISVTETEDMGSEATQLEFRVTDRVGHYSATKTLHVLVPDCLFARCHYQSELGSDLRQGESGDCHGRGTRQVDFDWHVTIKDGTKVIGSTPLAGG